MMILIGILYVILIIVWTAVAIAATVIFAALIATILTAVCGMLAKHEPHTWTIKKLQLHYDEDITAKYLTIRIGQSCVEIKSNKKG